MMAIGDAKYSANRLQAEQINSQTLVFSSEISCQTGSGLSSCKNKPVKSATNKTTPIATNIHDAIITYLDIVSDLFILAYTMRNCFLCLCPSDGCYRFAVRVRSDELREVYLPVGWQGGHSRRCQTLQTYEGVFNVFFLKLFLSRKGTITSSAVVG